MSIRSTATFLQARLGSTRLPRKALLPLAGMPVLAHAMESLRRAPTGLHVLLTDEASYPELAPLAEAHGFLALAGPEEDVLGRFALALERYPVTTIVRATGDNPLVSNRLIGKLLESHEQCGADFSAFDGPPLGTGVEVVAGTALRAAAAEARDPYEREHVSPFLYRRPERFRINRLRAEQRFCLPGAAVTLDTEDDYRFLARLYRELYRGEPIEILPLIAWLRVHAGAVEGLHSGT